MQHTDGERSGLSEVGLPDSDSEVDEPDPEVVRRERVKRRIHCLTHTLQVALSITGIKFWWAWWMIERVGLSVLLPLQAAC